MYKANQRHTQPLLISNVNELPEKKRQQLTNSWAQDFYRDFFCRIKEDAFSVLYANCPSRPNVPVNWLVGLETLKSGFGWSDEELYDHFSFDLQVRYALGIWDLNDSDFDLRTLYYFRERLSQYNLKHGVNLLNQAFEAITDQQLAVLKLKTEHQRMDSTQIASNIMDMSRLQLLVEALQRVQHMLSEADQLRYAELLKPFISGPSGQYVYRIKGQVAKTEHLEKIGKVMHRLLDELNVSYAQEPIYQMLRRFFEDNYRIEPETSTPTAKTNQELELGCLQSCDDLEATYRKKGQRSYKGYVGNVAETCSADNKVQLITKVQVAPNNVNDEDLLVDALPNLKARTNLTNLHTDGAFAGPSADPVLQEQHVAQIQSGIHGRVPDPQKLNLADFEIQPDEAGVPQQITCPQGQSVAVALSSHQRGYRADFDPQVCRTCPFYTQGCCPARSGKKRSALRITFLPSQLSVAQRRRRLHLGKTSGKNSRAAIEGTIREIKHPFPAGKLPVRGLFRITCLWITSAAMTNVRRISHYWEAKRKAERQQKATQGLNHTAQNQQDLSFFALSKAFWVALSVFVPFSKPCFGF